MSESDLRLCPEDCEICGGTGYYRLNVPVGHPKYGKLHPCPGWSDDIKLRNLDQVGLIQEDMERTWADFKLMGNLEDVLNRVRAVLERGYGWIYLWGDYGNGKTSILKTAVTWWILERTSLCSYISMSDLIEWIRQSYDEEHPSSVKERRLRKYADLDLVCIDEVDRVRTTDFMEEVKFSVLDKRYQRSLYKSGITIMTANVAPDMMDDYLKSRILDKRHEVLQIQTQDLRPYQMWEDKYDDHPLNGGYCD